MNEIIIYSDGGSRGNPGPGGAGYSITDKTGKRLKGKGFFLGQCTNNEAEYEGLINALRDCREFSPKSLKIFCDSELLVKQVKGLYKVKSPNLKPLYNKVIGLLNSFESWDVQHVYREENVYADKMANLAMDRKQDVEEFFKQANNAGKKTRLAVLISGGGRTMLNIQEHIDSGYLNAEISVVISSRLKVTGVERTKNAGLPLEIIRKKDFEDIKQFSNAILEILEKYKIDLVMLGGWLCLWEIPNKYENKVINTHPALLPSFGGQGMWGHHVHEAVLERGCKLSGCTVHFCTNKYDQGPIIIQRACEVKDDDDADKLADRVFEQECIAVPQAIKLFCEGKLKVEGRKVKVLS